MREERKALLFSAIFICVLFLCCVFDIYSNYNYITENTIRLHILPNSNAQTDQQLKLNIRDEILKTYGEEMASQSSFEMASAYYNEDKLSEINSLVERLIKSYGFNYTAKTTIDISDFPNRSYNEITLPKGSYTALKIEFGDGVGGNWWCVLYPPICIPTEELETSEEKEAIIELSDGTILKPKLATVEIVLDLGDKIENYFSK